MSFEAEVGYNFDHEISFEDCETKKAGNLRMCTLCGSSVSGHIKRHIFGSHLPWYFSPTSACWDCQNYIKGSLTRHINSSDIRHSNYNFSDAHLQLWCRLMFGILVFFANHLELGSVLDLLGFILAHNLFPETISAEANFDSDHVCFLKELCRSFQLTIPDTFSISPPNHVVCILHWKILVKLLAFLKIIDDWSEFKRFNFPISLPVQRQLGTQLSFIDSHCHLDTIMKAMNFRTFSHLQANLCSGEPHLQLCISNFVFPSRWFTIKHLLGKSPSVYGTIGVHPHAVIPGKEQEQVSQVSDHLRGGSFVGVGEVGLDFQSTCKCKPRCSNVTTCIERKKQAQRLFLHGVLPLADQYNLALVLHCRDDGDGAASEEVRLILKEKGLTHLRIHRHCFVGSVAEMQRWVNTFPNVMFGITAKSLDDPETKACLSKLKLEKIVLETDSPYLKKSGTNPWQVHLVADKLSHHKNIPLSVLVGVCNDNALKLYGLAN